MSDDTLVFAIIGLNAFLIMMMFPLMLFIKLGGYPEGLYRMTRIKYFSPIFIDAEKTPRRFILKLSQLKTGAPKLPPYFEFKGFANGVGRYYTNPTETTRHNGRSSWYYYPDNPFPIPILTMAQSPIISAENLEKAFDDETVLDFLKVGKEKKPKSSSRRLVLGVLGFFFIISILGMLFFLFRR